MTGTIKHEMPSQRRHFRVNAPIAVRIVDVSYETLNWSVIDFKIMQYDGTLAVGDQQEVELVVPYQGFEVRFAVLARVVAKDTAEHTLIGEFSHIDERQREILETFVTGLIKGEMESFEGVIRRMDVPVTPISLKPDLPLTPEEISRQEKRRRMGAVLYIAAGVLFSGALATIIYTNVFQLKVETAVMASPTDIILSPATGTIKEYLVKERTDTEKGALLVSFEDPELERDIERASLKLEEAMLLNGKSKTAGAESTPAPDAKEVESANAGVRALEGSVGVKWKALVRLRELLAQGLTRKDAVDKAEAEYYQAQSELNNAKQQVGQLSQKSTSKLSLLSIAEGEYSLLKQQRDRLVVFAPEEGRVLTKLMPAGASVRYGDPVAIYQHDDPKYVEAYLTREEALSVKPGTMAKVHFPSLGFTAPFRVDEVDYASQLVSRRDGRYTLEQAGMLRDVLVRLVLPEGDDAEQFNQIVPGSAAVVVFPRSPFGE